MASRNKNIEQNFVALTHIAEQIHSGFIPLEFNTISSRVAERMRVPCEALWCSVWCRTWAEYLQTSSRARLLTHLCCFWAPLLQDPVNIQSDWWQNWWVCWSIWWILLEDLGSVFKPVYPSFQAFILNWVNSIIWKMNLSLNKNYLRQFLPLT